jgi:hypothetical protein
LFRAPLMANARVTEINKTAIHGSSQRALLRPMCANPGNRVMVRPLQSGRLRHYDHAPRPVIGSLPLLLTCGRKLAVCQSRRRRYVLLTRPLSAAHAATWCRDAKPSLSRMCVTLHAIWRSSGMLFDVVRRLSASSLYRPVLWRAWSGKASRYGPNRGQVPPPAHAWHRPLQGIDPLGSRPG